ncbi:hypothetical protein [Amycolatopsis albispora]|uniref:Uncharacterized protein n=1 Tax=Amycolatopsis albispora TaxID=1804986 RepID=A0A344L595_9PSEU|nr:hypothetical protein [Amycolatopsis albispora]AXB43219.1 hypothetical protein A4R43_12215 [Amycolatopsis albispora]
MTRYDMDPDGVSHGINRFRAAGEAFESAWQARRAALAASASGLGGDVMTQAFLSRYLPIAERLMARADGLSGSYRGACDDMQCCVDDYLAANTEGTATVHRLTGGDERPSAAP